MSPPYQSEVYTRCEVLLATLRGRTHSLLEQARDLRWMLHRAVALLTPEQHEKFSRRVAKEAERRRRVK